MNIAVLHFDVFTTEPGKGNPAGIVLSAQGMSGSDMQALAARTGFPDTAFVSDSAEADFRIRYFSPRREVELCGHATIAASMALHLHGHPRVAAIPSEFTLATNAGILPIRLETNADGERRVVMTQAASQFRRFDGDPAKLAQALGIDVADLHPTLPVIYGSTGRWTLVVPVQGLDAMRRMNPKPQTFPDVLTGMPGASIHPFCLETESIGVDLHARHFSSPSSGTLEDPVTGTASGVLGAYYRTFVEKDATLTRALVIEQGCEIGRAGRVLVWAERDGDRYAVRIAGTACFVDQRVL